MTPSVTEYWTSWQQHCFADCFGEFILISVDMADIFVVLNHLRKHMPAGEVNIIKVGENLKVFEKKN